MDECCCCPKGLFTSLLDYDYPYNMNLVSLCICEPLQLPKTESTIDDDATFWIARFRTSDSKTPKYMQAIITRDLKIKLENKIKNIAMNKDRIAKSVSLTPKNTLRYK